MKMLEISKKATLLLGLLLVGLVATAQDPAAGEALSVSAEPADIPIYAKMGISSTTLFIIMNLFTALLLFLMVSMANSTKNILKHKQQEVRKKSANGAKVILALVGLFASGSAMAAAQPLEAYQGLIPFSDQVFWAYVIVDIILTMFIIHFAGIVKGSISDKVVLKKLFRWKKINKALTDAVEVEEEASILLDHDYDGIKELDNNLPPWWKYGFYITIVWAVVYFSYYHVFQIGDLQKAEFEAAMEAGEREVADYKAAHPELINADNVELLTDNGTLMTGKGIYDKNCASCHMEGGAGGVGPNLTDNYWIYEKDIRGVFITISEGAQNGMKAWKNDLPPDKIQAVASYILGLEYIGPENGGKEPQGEEK